MAYVSNRLSRSALRLLAAFVFAASVAGVFAGTALASSIQLSGSMEGAIKVSPGDWIAAGYHFTLPGSHPADTVQLANAQVILTGPCTAGGTGTVVIPLSAGPYDIPVNDNSWWPTSSESTSSSYQGAVQAPASLCGGTGQLDASSGAILTGDLQASDASTKVNLQFHYRDPNAKGQGNVDCSSGSYSSSVCGASWSGTGSYLPDTPITPVPVAAVGGLLMALFLTGALALQQKRRRRRHAAVLVSRY